MINKIENYYLKGTKQEIKSQLDKMDYYKREIYKEGNDGKRGGVEHDYIEVVKDKSKKFYNI